MPAMGVAGSVGSYPAPAAGSSGSGSTVPFFYGSNWYSESFAQQSVTLDANTHEFSFNVSPGGFLRGVRLDVSTTTPAGVGGVEVANTGGIWNLFQNITLENIDGSPIIYPMSGFSHYVANKYARPWFGDPAKRDKVVTTAGNANFSLFIQPEIRNCGMLANTDARALYRVRFTINNQAAIYSTLPATLPTYLINCWQESYSQPDTNDLHGNKIESIPPGMNLSTLRRHQIFTLNGPGTDNTVQLSLTGNEIRMMAFILRDSNGNLQDAMGNPIRFRVDNRSLGTFSPAEVWNLMDDQYDFLQGYSAIDKGTYVFNRFYQPGKMIGSPWLATTNATYVLFEFVTDPSAANGTGTIEVITDEVAPTGNVPMEFESI